MIPFASPIINLFFQKYFNFSVQVLELLLYGKSLNLLNQIFLSDLIGTHVGEES